MRVSPAAAGAIAGALLLGGCAGAPTPESPSAAQACRERVQDMDRRIREAGVSDAGARAVDGFAHLRLDRPLAAARPGPRDPAFDTWVRRARELDRRARALEMSNLGVDPAARRGVEDCAAAMLAATLADPSARETLAARARVPDDYAIAARVLGLYPLASVGMLAGVAHLRAAIDADFRAPLEALPVRGRLVRFVPVEDSATSWTGPVARDALQMPAPTPAALRRLFDRHAPVFEVDVVQPDDRPGEVTLHARSGAFVDPSRPTVYRRHTATRLDGRWRLQLEYWIWFASRPADGPLDILAGHLDGLVWRVTLDDAGRALAYDSIHPCGCYHLVFPTRALAARTPPARYEELLLEVPPPEPGPGRVVLRIAARSHFIQRAYRGGDRGGVVYATAPYDRLRSLPLADGTRRSLFDADGLVPGTDRPERWLLWMSGIARPGAMRQAGRHAVAFVGRRHFDDPDLLDRFFRLRPP